MQLSEQEFWNWQNTGSYSSIGASSEIMNFEFKLDEPATGFMDGAAKFLLSSGYSLVNSPKVMLTGRTWSGASQTSTERIGSFIDVVGNSIPLSKMSKVDNPGSWYQFKRANKHIPILKKKGVYEAEIRKYKFKSKSFDAFKKVKDFAIDPLNNLNDNQEEE